MPLPRITGRELQHPAQGLAESLAASVHNKAGSQAPVSHKASTGTLPSYPPLTRAEKNDMQVSQWHIINSEPGKHTHYRAPKRLTHGDRD